MKIVVVGAAGYIGWPLYQRLVKDGHHVIGIDDGSKEFRHDKKHSVMKYKFVTGMLDVSECDVIINVAAQPSGVFSNIDEARASYTQFNNLDLNVFLLWRAKKLGAHYIETTTTGIYSSPKTSWYHINKHHCSLNIQLAAWQHRTRCTEMRTAVVYGNHSGPSKTATATCVDSVFGTFVNRWVAQAVAGLPITVYGSGDQVKPIISLHDCVETIVRQVMDNRPIDRYTKIDQYTRSSKIIEVARTIQKITWCKICFVNNNRREDEQMNTLRGIDPPLEPSTTMIEDIEAMVAFWEPQKDALREELVNDKI